MKNVARDEKLVFVVNCDYPGKILKNFTLLHNRLDGKAGGDRRPTQPVQVVRELARRLGVPALHTRLDGKAGG